MSPFAGFPNFKACVEANRDKASPEGFCAWLEGKSGKHQDSAFMTLGLPDEVQGLFWKTFDDAMTVKTDEVAALQSAYESAETKGWIHKKQGWMRRADNKQVKTRSVVGVPIFASGVHNGDKYTREDLSKMLLAFKELKGRLDPPVKLGHTSDEFNIALAKKMGIHPELVGGDGGNGAMAFGWIGDIRMHGNVLYADLTDVPVVVAELIEGRQYKNVSCEVAFGYKDGGKTYPKVITGLALLGSELPAVKESGLETAAVYTMVENPTAVIEFSEEVSMGGEYQGNIDALVDWCGQVGFEGCVSALSGKEGISDPERLCGWLKAQAREKGVLSPAHQKQELREEVSNMQKEVYAELGLDEKASDEQVLSAVKALKEAASFKALKAALGLDEKATLQDVEGAVKTLKGKAEAGDKVAVGKFADLENKVKTLTTDLTAEKRKGKVAEYVAIFKALPAVSGKPEELADRIVKLEDADPEAAKIQMAMFKDMNDKLVAAGVFKNQGSPREGNTDEHPFVKKARQYSQDKGVTLEAATVALKKTDPDGWREYRKATKPVPLIDNNPSKD